MANYPKIIFRYSFIYDLFWREVWLERNKKIKNHLFSKKKILNYIKKVERLWKKDEKKILRELSRISSLNWQEKIINCYIISIGISFSEPLTMSLTMPSKKGLPKNIKEDYFIDILIHELIHRLLNQECNSKKFWKAYKFFQKKYSKDDWNTILHVMVFAIYWQIYLKLFNEKRLKQEIKTSSSFPDPSYRKAWQIVEKEGYQNIIKEFQKRIK